MVRVWVLYIIGLFSCIFYAFYSGSEVSFLILKLLMITPILSAAWFFVGFISTSVQFSHQALTMNKLDFLDLKFTIKNKGPFMVPFVKIMLEANGLVFHPSSGSYLLSMKPRSEQVVDLKIQGLLIGSYKIIIKGVYICDLLGFFRLKKVRETSFDVLVLPRVLNIHYLQVNHQNPFIKPTTETDAQYDIRNFRHGDTMRFVHWKLSAKKDQLMVKHPEKAESTMIAIILDLNYPNAKEHPLILRDKLIEAATAFIHYCVTNYIPFKLLFYDDSLLQEIANVNVHNFESLINRLAHIHLNSKVNVSYMIENVAASLSINDLVIFTPESYGQVSDSINFSMQNGINCYYYNINELSTDIEVPS